MGMSLNEGVKIHKVADEFSQNCVYLNLMNSRIVIVGFQRLPGKEAAHHSPFIQNLWTEFYEVCTYEKPVNVSKFQNLFSEFEPVAFQP